MARWVVKRCKACGFPKTLREFHPRSGVKSGVQARCKDCLRPVRAAKARAFRKTESGREYTRQALKRWLAKHPDYERTRSRRRLATDPKYRAVVKRGIEKWNRAHPEYFAVKAHERRVLVEQAGPMLTAEEWKTIVECFEGACVYCGSTKRITLDHVQPLSRGGNHRPFNVVPACKGCNSSKHSLDLEDAFPRLEKRDPDARARFAYARRVFLPRVALEMRIL